MKYITLYIWNSNGVEQKKQALETTSNAFEITWCIKKNNNHPSE